MRSRLTLEERDDLSDLLQHPGLKGLLKELEGLVEEAQWAVVKFNLSSGTEQQLVQTHCRAEGAANLLLALKRRLEALKPKKEC